MTAPAARSSPLRFLALGVVWAASLLWLIRLPAIERALINPLTALQGRIALWYTGAATLPVTVTLACSGADVLAVCLAATLAYPLPWSRRLLGAVGGALLVLSLNTVRIGILAHAVGSPWFTLLHEHILPALLVLAVVLWLVVWLQFADPRPGAGLSRPGRIIAASAAALGLYVAAGPWLESSGLLLSAAFGAARASGWLLNTIGIPCAVAGNVLHTPRTDVIVTTECVVTPLMPVYLAMALTVPATWTRRLIAALGFVPLFSLLIVVRLLTVALPPIVGGTPLVLTHAFHQIVLGLVTVVLMRWWAVGQPGRADVARIALACAAAAGTLFLLREIAPTAALAVLGRLHAIGVHAPTTLLVAGDTQGALYLLPSFACALLVALWVVAPPHGWSGFALSAAATMILAIAWIAGQSEIASRFHLTLPVVWTRAAGVAAPLLAVLAARSLHDASPLRPGVRRQRRAHASRGVASR